MTFCGNCPGLEHCGPAMQVYMIGKSFEEAGGKVMSVSMTCPAGLGKSRGTPLTATRPMPQTAQDCNTGTQVSGQGRGDVTALPVSQTVDAAIKQLSREGLSSRQIAEQLGMFGLQVSHMTVARHLRKAKAVDVISRTTYPDGRTTRQRERLKAAQ